MSVGLSVSVPEDMIVTHIAFLIILISVPISSLFPGWSLSVGLYGVVTGDNHNVMMMILRIPPLPPPIPPLRIHTNE